MHIKQTYIRNMFIYTYKLMFGVHFLFVYWASTKKRREDSLLFYNLQHFWFCNSKPIISETIQKHKIHNVKCSFKAIIVSDVVSL